MQKAAPKGRLRTPQLLDALVSAAIPAVAPTTPVIAVAMAMAVTTVAVVATTITVVITRRRCHVGRRCVIHRLRWCVVHRPGWRCVIHRWRGCVIHRRGRHHRRVAIAHAHCHTGSGNAHSPVHITAGLCCTCPHQQSQSQPCRSSHGMERTVFCHKNLLVG